MALPGDDDVVMHGNSDCRHRIHDLPRHRHIRTRGRGVAGRVVVDQHDRRGAVRQRAGDDFARVDRCMVDCAYPGTFAGDELVLLVEEKYVKLFAFGGEVIQSFTAAMIFGVVIGTYSSIFIAAPLLILFNLRSGRVASEEDGKADGVEPAKG